MADETNPGEEASPTAAIPKCSGCGEHIYDRFILKVLDGSWHAKCLKCHDCHAPLSDKCFSKGDQVYCKDDFFNHIQTCSRQWATPPSHPSILPNFLPLTVCCPLSHRWAVNPVTPLHSRLHHRCSPCTLASITAAAGWSIQQRPCSLASITIAAGRSTHCPGTLASITAAAGWSTQRCPWTLALIINIAAVS
ncbi:hypothetical protein ACOMHN_001565 [Nucella lapillus]